MTRAIGGLVLAGLVLAACDGKRAGGGASPYDDTRAKIARIGAQKLAFEAYPQWAVTHPDARCPKALSELGEFLQPRDLTDPWGHPYVILCGAAAPAAAKGFGAISYGADGVAGGTGGDADVDSWTPTP